MEARMELGEEVMDMQALLEIRGVMPLLEGRATHQRMRACLWALLVVVEGVGEGVAQVVEELETAGEVMLSSMPAGGYS